MTNKDIFTKFLKSRGIFVRVKMQNKRKWGKITIAVENTGKNAIAPIFYNGIGG